MIFRRLLGTVLMALAGLFAAPAHSVFDPVHEDIDIFMVNPAVNPERPNVLILLDNTANWNQAFANEKSALVSLINGLNANFNVGLGMYAETGSPNDNEDGAYIRFAVRQMAGSPQATLSGLVSNLSQTGDKGNNTTIGLAMSEVYKYFAGATSHSSHGKVKTDHAGNSANPAGSLPGNALPANPGPGSLFNSPVASNCQKNYLIYIGNGKVNENISALTAARNRLEAAQGNAPQTIPISPNGQQGNWADEWARFLAKTGFIRTIGGQARRIFVNTYAVAIDPGERNLWGQGNSASTNDSLRLMKSMSEDNGNGKYFEVASGNGGAEIVAALSRIFSEIQSVNSVFAATTLPVSVNVRGTNLNQVYIGMFRPDAGKAPRWYGNLKMYKLKANSSRSLYLADAADARVEDPVTGFVGRNNRSFWTRDSTFWSFRTESENGAGGISDAPDGDLVEKGAVAQWLRETNAASQAGRRLYTCTAGSGACAPCTGTGGGSSQDCSGGSTLSATPFATGNADITPGSLGLASATERDQLIDWVRGQDNSDDENRNGSGADCRASVHGDVLHSRPAVINYNRYGGDNDVYVFYGANDGVFRAVKGGAATDTGDAAGLQPGQEAWGFVPEESFSHLKRLRSNTPVIASATRKPYFMDGPIGVYSRDANGDGRLQAGNAGDRVHLYVGARRGGRFIYSLDVTDPLAPAYRWRIGNGTAGFGELGQTWSQATVVTGINSYANPVLIFGGGYDPAVEDIENCTIQSAGPSQVRHYTGAIKYTATGCTREDGSAIGADDTPSRTVARSMGRAIYVVDAITGELVWWAGGPGSGASLEVAGLDFAIPGDPAVIRNESGGQVNRAYFGDTGGNVWRFDFGSGDRSRWSVTRIAALADLASPAGRRKFLYPPDVVQMSGHDAVLIGSGDREHPFDMTVANRFYMLKDRGNDNGPLTGVDNSEASATPTITESRLFDATSVSRTTASFMATAAQKGAAIQAAAAGIASADGWHVSFTPGEKGVGNAVALNGTVFFNTNVSPLSPQVTSSENCGSNLGIANQYQVGIAEASTQTYVHPGGGYLPSPVHVVVQVDVTVTDPNTGQPVTTKETIEGVVSGTEVSQPPGIRLGNRTRRFWYKEID